MHQSTIGTHRECTLGAVAYLLTLWTGVLVLLLAKPHERIARWHAAQAIALGIIVFAAYWVLNLLSASLSFVLGPGAASWSPFWNYAWLSFGHIALLPGLAVSLMAAVRSHRGDLWRIPLAAALADRLVQPVADAEPASPVA